MTATVRRHVPAATPSADLAASLESVRRALLDDAGDEAARLIDAARREAESRVGAAEDEAGLAVEQARQRAQVTAAARSARAVGAARRDAHAVLLHAEAAVRSEFEVRLHRAVESMSADPRYPALLDRLEGMAHLQLGEEATIHRDPSGGGVLAESEGRCVDYRLSALADRAAMTIADEVAALWA